jgi:NAD(P)H-flavin reductase
VEKLDGTVLMVAGGVGLAALYPIMRAHVEIGNDVHVVYGSRNRDLFFWLDRLHALLPEAKVSLSTDDGSLGTKGFVTDVLRQKCLGTSEAEFAVVVGPAIMMRETSKLLLVNDTSTIVSLNPTMLDGSAMCGGCKVSRMNGKLGAKDFACNDGPDRPASEVDLDELVSRLATYRAEETRSLAHHIWQGLAA